MGVRERARESVREKWQDPIFWTDVIQLVKTVIAAVLAWILATTVLHLPQSFLAPWSALLVVHATVYRTFSKGARQVGSAVVGVLLAWAVGNTLGLDPGAVAVALFLGLVLGSSRWFKDEATAIAATALVVLTTGFSDDDSMLVSRLLDTAIGIGVGLAVNLLVWPPLRRRTAIVAMDAIDDRIGELLTDMADGLGEGCDEEDIDRWIDRTRDLDADLDQAWSLVRQAQESARMNPRRSAAEIKDPKQWYRLLRRMEQAVADTRSMCRTLAHSLDDVNDWQPRFRDTYVDLLRDAGAAIVAADPEPIREIHDRINTFVRDLSDPDAEALEPRLWPEYGGLIINLRNIVVAMDEVAESNPMSQPPPPVPFLPRESGPPRR